MQILRKYAQNDRYLYFSSSLDDIIAPIIGAVLAYWTWDLGFVEEAGVVLTSIFIKIIYALYFKVLLITIREFQIFRVRDKKDLQY